MPRIRRGQHEHQRRKPPPAPLWPPQQPHWALKSRPKGPELSRISMRVIRGLLVCTRTVPPWLGSGLNATASVQAILDKRDDHGPACRHLWALSAPNGGHAASAHIWEAGQLSRAFRHRTRPVVGRTVSAQDLSETGRAASGNQVTTDLSFCTEHGLVFAQLQQVMARDRQRAPMSASEATSPLPSTAL